MEALQRREREIFETLRHLKEFSFVIIGGYAVNVYTLPRFSVDCDIVVKDEQELSRIKTVLLALDYAETKSNELQYSAFTRFEKVLEQNFSVSIDSMVREVKDRMTKAIFSAEWIFKNSDVRFLKGKTIAEQLKLRIISSDALVVMKFVCGRATDIRDIFMLAHLIKDKKWVWQEIHQRYNFEERFQKIKEKVLSKQFKDGLQGVYGYIDHKTFEKHAKAILDLEK